MSMTITSEAVPAHSMFTVLASLGEATASAVAEHAQLGYSTVTAKLRAWERTGQCERLRTDDGRTLWRLTDAGRTATATAPPDDEQPPTPPASAAPTDHRDAIDEPPPSGDLETPTGHPPVAADSDHTEDPDADAEMTTSPVPDAGQEPSAEPTPRDGQGSSVDEGTLSETRQGTVRRAKGSLRGAVLDILEAHPDRAYRTGELCKLIDAANAGVGGAKASAGAVANAVTKLVADGKAVQTLDRPATYQLAPASSGQ
jgi:DNA-binding MarR family transcriptional regulator